MLKHSLHNTPVLITALLAGCFFTTTPSSGQGAPIITEELKVSSEDGTDADYFGTATTINSGVIGVGAYLADADEVYSGAAYLFDATTGTQLRRLLPNDGRWPDEFGFSIDIDTGIVAVGARSKRDNGVYSGAAYLFNLSSGAQLAKLLPDQGGEYDRFGTSIAINNQIVAIGAPQDYRTGVGSGYACLFDVSTRKQIALLLPSDGQNDDHFGRSIALYQGVVAIGAPGNDFLGDRAGAVYLFDVTTGAQIAVIRPEDGAANHNFGANLAITDGIIAITATGDNDNGDRSGAAYLYDIATRRQIAKLLPSDGADFDYFGMSIAIHKSIVAVGASSHDALGLYSGAAYLFDAKTSQQFAKLLPSDSAKSEHFGSSVAIANNTVAVGAYRARANGFRPGAAYIFDANAKANCITLIISNLVAGKTAIFTILNGTPGAKAITLVGFKPGKTTIDGALGYCATFGFKITNPNQILGGTNRTFDQNGKITFHLDIPNKTTGLNVLFQAAHRSTCPDECMSNLIQTTVQ